MVYLLAPHASALQTNTTKFKQDFIGPLFIDMALDKTHYRLKDTTGLLLDGTYHMNHIKKGSARMPLGIVDKFDTYEAALKNTLLNKFAIEMPNNKLQEVTLQDGSERSHNLDRSFRNIYIVPSFPTREQHAHSVQNARSRFNKLNQSYPC